MGKLRHVRAKTNAVVLVRAVAMRATEKEDTPKDKLTDRTATTTTIDAGKTTMERLATSTFAVAKPWQGRARTNAATRE